MAANQQQFDFKGDIYRDRHASAIYVASLQPSLSELSMETLSHLEHVTWFISGFKGGKCIAPTFEEAKYKSKGEEQFHIKDRERGMYPFPTKITHPYHTSNVQSPQGAC